MISIYNIIGKRYDFGSEMLYKYKYAGINICIGSQTTKLKKTGQRAKDKTIREGIIIPIIFRDLTTHPQSTVNPVVIKTSKTIDTVSQMGST